MFFMQIRKPIANIVQTDFKLLSANWSKMVNNVLQVRQLLCPAGFDREANPTLHGHVKSPQSDRTPDLLCMTPWCVFPN